MQTERVTEFPITQLDRLPRKRQRLGWDVAPLIPKIQASSAIGLLQSDVKAALKSTFGTLDGPLSVIDWCKGRCQSVDARTFLEALSAESSVSEYRDSCNAGTTSVEDPLSPPQASISVSSGLRDGGKGDDTTQRRQNQEHYISESELQLGSRKRLLLVPYPSILVGDLLGLLKIVPITKECQSRMEI